MTERDEDISDEQRLKWRRKRKILFRTYGGLLTVFAGSMEGLLIYHETSELTDTQTSKELLELAGLNLALIPFMITGMYDLIRGTHHYLPMKVSQKIIRNERFQSWVQEDLDIQDDLHLQDILGQRKNNQ